MSKISYFDKNDFLDENKKLNSKIDDFFYTAPEILVHREFNYKCDIWSLGCVIYEMVTLSLIIQRKENLVQYLIFIQIN